MSPTNPRARHHVLGIVALSLFAALFTRLWYLQVLTTDEYELAASRTRTRTVIVDAPRGRILDRNGEAVVENRRTIQVSISYQRFEALDEPRQGEVLRRLARELNRDQVLRQNGAVPENDPGPMPADPDAPESGAEPPGEEPGTTGPEDLGPDELPGTGDEPQTEEQPPPPDDDPSSAGDPVAPPDPDAGRLPPAGVATGAQNPNGQQDVEPEAPEPHTPETLRDRLEDPRFDKFKPIPVATDISEQLEIYLHEHEALFPTVSVTRVTVRDYRYGALLAHVLGYVGPLNGDELKLVEDETDKPYENDDDIGKTGIEADMESDLRGTPGRVVYEVDARNRAVREIRSRRQQPLPGNDVYLTIDINLQYLAEKGLAAEIERRRGVTDDGCFVKACDTPGAAVVAIQPDTGQVLAMASYPTYDPNLFIGGISSADYKAITDEARGDQHDFPLLNRAISGQYAPGSTFKLFSAYAGLATGQITPEFIHDDTGSYAYCEGGGTCVARNADNRGYGPVNLARALTVSSDTYFYRLGDESWLGRGRIGEEGLQEKMRLWGLGERSGIGLPGEAPGRIPTPAWLREFSADINDDPAVAEDLGTWRGGTSGNTAVGQGDVLVTPLQLANGYATLANGGTVYKPQFVLQVTRAASDVGLRVPDAEVIGQVDLPPEWRLPLIQGFDGVTKPGTGGTATKVFTGFDQSSCSVAGKTGTAQVDGKNDTSLFTAFAPTEGAEIAVAAVLQETGFGGSAAAPVVRRMLEPFALSGCDLRAMQASGRYAAPLGGWFDVDAAVEEFVPAVPELRD